MLILANCLVSNTLLLSHYYYNVFKCSLWMFAANMQPYLRLQKCGTIIKQRADGNKQEFVVFWH